MKNKNPTQAKNKTHKNQNWVKMAKSAHKLNDLPKDLSQNIDKYLWK